MVTEDIAQAGVLQVIRVLDTDLEADGAQEDLTAQADFTVPEGFTVLEVVGQITLTVDTVREDTETVAIAQSEAQNFTLPLNKSSAIQSSVNPS